MSFDLIGKAVKKLRLPTVDYSNSSIKVIPAKQKDANSRFFIVELYDDRGIIDLSNYRSAADNNFVILNAELPDGTKQIAYGQINEDNSLVCRISQAMLEQEGTVICDISLKGTDEAGDIIWLTSQTFYIAVMRTQYDDEVIESSDEYNLLVEVLQEIEEKEIERAKIIADLQTGKLDISTIDEAFFDSLY